MTDIVTLESFVRENTGTSASRKLRREGFVPVVIYSNKMPPVHLYIEEREITKYYRKPRYITQQFCIDTGKEKYKVIPKCTPHYLNHHSHHHSTLPQPSLTPPLHTTSTIT
ncbi:MAG TPA: hypothetical protein QKA14_00695, partial [Candidatus Megaira endosymbiont of Hartmannula sinica]|nr:hypothetical protein [Candidatus Megaera endosymbiont of Hartmannula sinica]